MISFQIVERYGQILIAKNRKLLHEQLVYMIATFIPILHVGANAGNDPIVSSAIYKALSVDTYVR